VSASNIIVLKGSIIALRAALHALARKSQDLHSLFEFMRCDPEAYSPHRQAANGHWGAVERHSQALPAGWPGDLTAHALRDGAERLLADMNRHSLKSGIVLRANTLLETYRIVGGLFPAANARDPVTFRHRADERAIQHWSRAVLAADVEYPKVIAALKRGDATRWTAAASIEQSS
jgi:hypothetical protein